MSTYLQEALDKWAPVLDDESTVAEHGALTGDRRKATAIVMENTIREQGKVASSINEAVPSSSTANVANYDPVIVGLLRRAMPKLMPSTTRAASACSSVTATSAIIRTPYTSKTGD